ncbi:MAG TPA: hypothetical protein VLH09_08955, partial [Bryobacteraceae bacterium]|nr:hypothetical protein [Bryobacteraceae bacterium]
RLVPVALVNLQRAFPVFRGQGILQSALHPATASGCTRARALRGRRLFGPSAARNATPATYGQSAGQHIPPRHLLLISHD